MGAPRVPSSHLRGMALSCALGADRGACVDAVRAGRLNRSRVILDALDEPVALNYYRIADGADLFDPERMQRLLPPVVEGALDEAGLSVRERRGLPIFVGSSCFSIAREESHYAAALAKVPERALPMRVTGFDLIASLARDAAGSTAASYTWNTACSSAANALVGAHRAIALGRCRRALVVGVELANLTTLSGFSALQLTADEVRPFDADRSGIVLGEGVSAVVLDAEPARDVPLRIVAGASNCDTHGVTGANPDGRSIAAVISGVLRRAGTGPERIRVLKAHGTGTPSNDAAEARGMHRAFPELPPVCALKPWLGHTMGACGLNELVLFASAIERGFVPAAAGFDTVDPDLDVSPLTAEMPAGPGLYLLNQFGFGGNNAVFILERT